MRIIALVLTLTLQPACAGDFRLLDFGASCADVASQEVALGAKEVKWSVEGIGVRAFEGLAFDRKLVFTYFCPKGVLVAGDYYFPLEPLSDAVVSYEAAHKHLSATYGQAFSDNSPWSPAGIDPRPLERDPRKYLTTWISQGVSVTTILLPSKEPVASLWRVAVHFGETGIVRGDP
jgi:hypothetical protein